MHGDAHPGNMYFYGGKAGLLDWQAVRRGVAALDDLETIAALRSAL
jgi:aminoglycoside phosphotransferase (APT) family kinase protein